MTVGDLSWRRAFLEGRAELVGIVDAERCCTERFGKLDEIGRSEVSTYLSPVVTECQQANQIITAVTRRPGGQWVA